MWIVKSTSTTVGSLLQYATVPRYVRIRLTAYENNAGDREISGPEIAIFHVSLNVQINQ